MFVDLSFEQIIAILSLIIAALSLLFSLAANIINHKSAMKVLMTEKRIDAYCNLADIIMAVRYEGITDKNKAVLHKRTSAVMLLGSKKVKSAVNTYLHELQNGAVIPNDHLAIILNTLDNEIHSRSIFFSHK